MKIQVTNFWLQPTDSFTDGAPQREEYMSDEAFAYACIRYESEWRKKYECMNPCCNNRDCPQHFPN